MTNYYVTVAGGGDNSGDSWANAMTLSEFKTSIENAAVAGDNYFIAGGTYTVSTGWSSVNNGDATSHISLIGVNSGTTAEPPTSSDWASGTARPVFDSSTYMWLGTYKTLRNLRFNGSYNSDAITLSRSHIQNCYFENLYNSATASAIDVSTSVFFDCELVATYGRAIESNTSVLYGCYIHDSYDGVRAELGTTLLFSIIDTCTTGLNVPSAIYDLNVFNCSIYGCTTGVYAVTGTYQTRFLNNIISSCTDGFKCNNSGVVINNLIFDFNNWYNNTRDMSWDNGSTEDNSAKGLNAIAVNPNFTDAANGDFSLTAGSGLIDAGFGIQLGVG